MLMVIFGAGASYDSAPSYRPKSNFAKGSEVEDSRPPLAVELFENRSEFAAAITRFSECQPVIPYLREPAAERSVEQVLEQLQDQAEQYPPGLRQLTAIRYYLHFTIWQCENRWGKIHGGVTNYKTLLDQIERWRSPSESVCLVTFNYDTMLEAALPWVGVQIQNLGDYVNSKDYKLIKLHGSVNWGRHIEGSARTEYLAELDQSQVPGNVIQLSPELLQHKLVSKKYRIVHECPMTKAPKVALFPALAIPVETKRDFECPDNHLEKLKECIPDTTRLLVIGWRATDTPFLKLLSKNLSTNVSVMVVAGGKEEAGGVIRRMEQAGIKANQFRRVKSGFSDFIVNREADEFLKSS